MHVQPHRAKGALPYYAEGGFISKLFGSGKTETVTEKYARQDAERAAKDAKATPTAAAPAPAAAGGALNPANALKKREEAAGLAKGGKVLHPAKGAIRHPKANGTDTVEAMLTPEEFVVRAPAAKKIEQVAPGLLDALNAVGGDATASKLPAGKPKSKGAMRKMADGGIVLPDEDLKFQRAQRAPQLLQSQVNQVNQNLIDGARATAGAPAPISAPNYTTSAGAAPASNGMKFVMPPEPINATTSAGARPVPPPIPNGPSMDLKAFGPGKILNPNVAPGILSAEGATAAQAIQQNAAAQAQANAFAQAERFGPDIRAPGTAATPPPAAAPATPPPAAAAPPAATPPAAVGAARGALNTAGKFVAPIAVPVAAVSTAQTPTEQFEQRFGLDPYQGDSNVGQAVRDVGVRALGFASDLGNAMTLGQAGRLYRDLQGQSAAPAGAAPPPAGAVRPPVAATPAPATAPAVAPAPAAAGALPPAVVTRTGNSYTGAPGISGDISINGKPARGGFVSGTGDGTFRYGGGASEVGALNMGGGGGGSSSGVVQTGTWGDGTPMYQDAGVRGAVPPTADALHSARLGAIQRGDIDAVKASYGGKFGPKTDPIEALINNGKPMTVRKAAAIAAMQQSERDGARGAIDAKKAGVEFKAAEQLLAAQTKLTSAKTAEQRLAATEELRSLQGKYEKEWPNKFTVVPGGQEIGPDGMSVIMRPARVIDNQTRRFIDQAPTPFGNGTPTPRAQYDAMKKGDKYTGIDGKQYIKG